jgi:hypothetical protein
MFSYSPPGNLDDLAGQGTRDNFLADWHNYVLQEFRTNITPLEPNSLFFTEADTEANATPSPITWNAFPLTLSRTYGVGPHSWAAADVLGSTDIYTPAHSPSGKIVTKYRQQDEYCEWFVYHDQDMKLKRIVFSAEAPEYWIALAKADIDLVVKLYRQFVDPGVQKADLLLSNDLDFDATLCGVLNYDNRVLPAGSYNPFNVWNTEKGLMHLTHPANTLGAEINLAAVATPLRKDNHGARVVDVRRLVCCANYGVANRSSDPNIGWNVNTSCVPLAGGDQVSDATLANPVALYMNGLQHGKLTGPRGEPVDNWFQFRRGLSGMGLHAVLEPPAGALFGLDQVLVNGVQLSYGGQVAQFIDMVLYAKLKPHSGPVPATISCQGRCCMPTGTVPGNIPKINLDQTRDGAACGMGKVDAYPEITPPEAAFAPVEAEVLYHTAEKIADAPRLRTRLAK